MGHYLDENKYKDRSQIAKELHAIRAETSQLLHVRSMSRPFTEMIDRPALSVPAEDEQDDEFAPRGRVRGTSRPGLTGCFR